jgi:hypothetical protein
LEAKSLISSFRSFADFETSGEKTKVRLWRPRREQACHSSAEAKEIKEQLRTSSCIAGSDADNYSTEQQLNDPIHQS